MGYFKSENIWGVWTITFTFWLQITTNLFIVRSFYSIKYHYSQMRCKTSTNQCRWSVCGSSLLLLVSWMGTSPRTTIDLSCCTCLTGYPTWRSSDSEQRRPIRFTGCRVQHYWPCRGAAEAEQNRCVWAQLISMRAPGGIPARDLRQQVICFLGKISLSPWFSTFRKLLTTYLCIIFFNTTIRW